jgi:hypothetical protein
LWFAQSLFPHGISSSQIHDTKAGAVIVVDANDAVTLTGVTAAALEASNAFHFF